LGKLVDFDKSDVFVGKAALLKIKAEGATRKRVGFVIAGAPLLGCQHSLEVQSTNGKVVGVLSEFAYSHRFSKNIGVGMVATDIESDAQDLVIQVDGEPRKINVEQLPFDFS